MDEFDYLRQSENMSAVIKYVMTYFNEYLTLDTCDAENIKIKHKRDKLAEEIESKYPKSKDFILNYYLQNGIGIHREVKRWLEDVPYFPFYYSDDDFSSAAHDFYSGYKLKTVNMNEYHDGIQALMAEIKQCDTEEPKPSEMIHLDSHLVTWVRDTYRQYGVNLFSFAYDQSYLYYQKYVKHERGEWGEGSYYVNNYNHRYNSNPFDIDEIYEDNKHRPFLQDKRGELEMLVMHEWLFSMVYDDDYWPEYVNLCVDRGRVKIVQHINALLPVACVGLKYPDDIKCETEYIVLADGKLKDTPKGAYILKVEEASNNLRAWQDTETMLALTKSLDEIFKLYGTPKVLELAAPARTGEFESELFFTCCGIIEKKMKKHSGMKVAVLNGPGNQKSKPNSIICTIEDFIKFKVELRERKIRLQFSIDFPALLAGKRNSYNQGEILGALTNMKNSIAVLHITNMQNQPSFRPKYKKIGEDKTVEYLNKFKYPTYDDFYSVLSIIFNDNQQRYMIPKNVANDAQLEELVDNLLRAGFSFCSGGIQNE
jgi:hypothetical protein